MTTKRFIYFVLCLALLSTFILYNRWEPQLFNPTKSFLSRNSGSEFNSQRILEEEGDHHEVKLTPDQFEFWVFLVMVFATTAFAGMMSGLTVGYLSIDQLELEIKLKTGTQQEKEDAMAIMPILAKHHLLLSTLLLANALAMESLPIFLDALVPAVLAVLISTTLVLILGEVLPQAYCTGPSQIKIARAMAPVIKFLMFIFYPICYPISVGLDHLLGLHGKTRFVKQDLKALIELHKIDKSGAPKSHGGHDGHGINVDAQLTADEIKVINSTIDLRETPVTKEMERIEKVFMISNNAVIDQDMIKRISKSGFSKIPVYKNHDRNNVVGILKVKSLLGYEKFLGKTLEECQLPLIIPVIVAKDTSMLEMLMLFQEKKTSIAVVSDESVKDKGGNAMFFSRRNLTVEESRTKLIGVISLKDIFEEILESKMVDDDVHGAVTLHSGGMQMKKRFNRPQTGDINEAMERPEKGLKKPLLEL